MDDRLSSIKSQKILSDFVAEIVDLKSAGGEEYVGRCPFHEERTASFRVNSHRYHCFGCHAHGDIFSWITRTQNCTFAQAVELLSGNVQMGKGHVLRKKISTHCDYDSSRALAIMRTNEVAQKLFRLNASAGLARFTQSEVDRWGIGTGNCGLDGDLSLESQLEAALTALSSDGRPYPRYRNRLTIPLKGPSGHILGFLGRLIEDMGDGRPKYINPPETAAFARRRYLFGRDMLRAQPRCIFVVEGAIDAIKCISRGLKNVVATMGCKITQEQLDLLGHYNCPIYIFYDGDHAGLTASFEAAKLLVGAEFESWHILLTNDLDPDEFQARHRSEELRTLIHRLPRIRSTDFFQGKIMSKDIKPQYDRTLLDSMAKPYVDDNIKQGWPHYNVVDWVCAAYPQYSQGIKDALFKMATDVEQEGGIIKFKRDNIAAFLREWIRPCREVRKAHANKQ